MTRERKSLIAGVGVLIFTVILAGVAVTAHNNNEPQPEWLMVMNAETGEFQKDTTGADYTLSLTGLNAGTAAGGLPTQMRWRRDQFWHIGRESGCETINIQTGQSAVVPFDGVVTSSRVLYRPSRGASSLRKFDHFLNRNVIEGGRSVQDSLNDSHFINQHVNGHTCEGPTGFG